jgi:hypothetical protein
MAKSLHEIAKRSFENAAQSKYLGMTVPNQNLIQEEIKKRLNRGNACHPVCCLKYKH